MSSDWEEISFIKALDVNPAVKMQKGDIYPFVDMQSIEAGNKYVVASQERELKSSGSRFIEGDTLMARITPCLENGKISRYRSLGGSPAHGSTEFIVLRHRKGITHSEFVYYLTISDQVKPYAIAQMTGSSGRQRVPVNSLKHLTINLPPLPEQQAISEILKSLDDKIENNRKMNETLEKTASTLFKSWFVDFDPVKAKATISGKGDFAGWSTERAEAYLARLEPAIAALFPDSLKDSDLGPIPAGWEVKLISDFGQVICGKTPSKSNKEYYGFDVPFIKIPDMHSNVFATQTTDNLSEKGAQSQKNKFIPKGSICVSCIATVGKVVITSQESQTNQQINSIVPHKEIYSYFLFFAMRSLKKVFHDLASGGSATLNMNTSTFSRVNLIKPKEDVLEIYYSCIERIMNKILQNDLENQTLAEIRDALLPKLLSGEIDVSKEADND